MENNMNIEEQRIIGYLSGELSSEEEELLLAWIEESEENREYFMQIKSLWEISGDKRVSYTDINNEWEALDKKLTDKKQLGINPLVKRVLQYAAVLLVAIAGTLLFTYNSASGEQELSYFTTKVPKGQRSQLELPDGTKIWLNAESEITYPSNFKEGNRMVKFKGEGFFDVAKDTDHPFVIKTGRIKTTVLGTRFNLSAYPHEQCSVALMEGKVKVEAEKGNTKAVLVPGKQVVYNESKNQLLVGNIEDEEVYIAWTENKFVFRDEPFESLAKKLERWYDVKIHLQDKELKDYRYTGNFRNEETIWQVMDIIRLTTPIEYTQKHREVFITKKK